ncbi:MAG TPA: T9SS type A sorting domain-containing protein [Panacibacter sp.]|nr:T9SS type A sorting domain-containing protein [Panacibacter sp.]
MRIKSLLLITVLLSGNLFLFAQTPVIKWQRTIGGNGNDSLASITVTNDGGFIISGHSNSNISGNKTQNSFGGLDYWVVKLNKNGKTQWNITIGGSGIDRDAVIIPTYGGGYLLGGTSISDASGSKTENAINQSDDYWVIKLDKKGAIQWNNSFGGAQKEELVAMGQEKKDQSFRVVGNSYTNYAGFDKLDPNRGSSLWSDYWLVKLDRNGVVINDHSYGGGNEDIVTSMRPVLDSGYILSGYSYAEAENDKTDSVIGNCDYWLVKVDPSGNKIWDKTIGGIVSDYASETRQTFDRGYITGGYSNSPISFNKSGLWKGWMDYWIVKTDSLGIEKWDKTFGGNLNDVLSSIQQTADSGYIVGGTSNSDISNSKSENSKGLQDYWILKLDTLGKIVWDKTIGGSGVDRLTAIREISRGEYILGGTSNSPVSGDKTQATVGATGANDYWIVRLTSQPVTRPAKFKTAGSETTAATASTIINVNSLTMQASPNPTKGVVTLTYSSNDNKKISLKVYDNNGKIVASNTLPTSKSNYSLDISRQPAGTYYVAISSGKSSVTRKIIKE